MCTQKCRWSGGRRVHIRSIVDNNGASHSQAGVRVWRGEDKPLRWTLGDPAQGDLLTRLPASVPQLGARQHPSSPPRWMETTWDKMSEEKNRDAEINSINKTKRMFLILGVWYLFYASSLPYFRGLYYVFHSTPGLKPTSKCLSSTKDYQRLAS